MTPRIPTRVLDAFGLTEADLIGEPVVVPRRHPLRSPMFEIGLDDLVEAVAAGGAPLQPVDGCPAGLDIFHVEHDPRVVVVRAHGARVLQQSGVVRELAGGDLLLASSGPDDESWVLIDGPTGPVRVGLVDGEVRYE